MHWHLIKSASITAAPVYTILSLIPPIAISFVSWTLKAKLEFPEPQENEHTADNMNGRRNADAVPEKEKEHTSLLAVDENHSASERNSTTLDCDNGQDYGATRDEDHETNC